MPVNGLVTMTPTSIASVGIGSSSSINTNGSVTFSLCTDVSLNGVFTSSYDNYMISMRFSHSDSTSRLISSRLRASGTDETLSTYVYQQLIGSGTSLTGARATTTRFGIGQGTSTQRNGLTLFLFGPYLTQATAIRSTTVDSVSGASTTDFAGTNSVSTAYDGITITTGLGSFSGLITVYGFNQ